jgi:hypothetical protein
MHEWMNIIIIVRTISLQPLTLLFLSLSRFHLILYSVHKIYSMLNSHRS